MYDYFAMFSGFIKLRRRANSPVPCPEVQVASKVLETIVSSAVCFKGLRARAAMTDHHHFV